MIGFLEDEPADGGRPDEFVRLDYLCRPVPPPGDPALCSDCGAPRRALRTGVRYCPACDMTHLMPNG